MTLPIKGSKCSLFSRLYTMISCRKPVESLYLLHQTVKLVKDFVVIITAVVIT